uniref:Ycf2 n=1 Tax=Todea barbara TaxID=90702 RepID=UPI0023D83901|nr:Ycf2 [Todea barbara]WDE24573.1 Ycf2 [Todea barbara]
MREETVKSPYSLSKVSILGEINRFQYLFKLLTNLNLVRFLIGIFYNYEPFIKLFDLRILSSLILRDLRGLTNQNNGISLGLPVVLAIAISMHRSNNRSLIERNNLDLVRLVNGHTDSSRIMDETTEEYTEPFYSPASLQISLSVGRDRRTYKNDLMDSEEYSYRGSMRIQPQVPVRSTVDPSVSGWWRIWIIRDLLPSRKISRHLIDKVRVLLEDKSLEDLETFFEFYTNIMYRKDYDWRNDFDSFILRKNNQNRDIDWQPTSIPRKSLFLSVILAFCEKVLFEYEGPLDRQKYESPFYLDGNYLSNPFLSYEDTSPSYEDMTLSYRDIKDWLNLVQDKGWALFQDYADFYIWRSYYDNYSSWKGDKHELEFTRFLLRNKFIELNYLVDDQLFDGIPKILTEILYSFSKYISSKVRTSSRSDKYDTESENSLSFIPRDSEEGMAVETTPEIDSRDETQTIRYNYLPFEKDDASKFFEEDSISNIAKDSFSIPIRYKNPAFKQWNWKQFPISNLLQKENDISNTDRKSFSSEIPSLIDSEKGDLGEDPFAGFKGFVASDSSSKEGRILIDNLSKAISHGFSDALSRNEPKFSQIFDKVIPNEFMTEQRYEYFRFSENSRMVDLWKMKRYSHSPLMKHYLLLEDGLSIGEARTYPDGEYPSSNKNWSLHLFRSIFNGNSGEFSILHTYSRIRNGLINGMNELVLAITTPNSILSNERIASDSDKYSKVSVSEYALSIGQIFNNELGIINIESFDQRILESIGKDSLGIGAPRGGNDKDRISLLWNGLKAKADMYSISSLIKSYERNRIISLCSIYTLYIYDYIHILYSEYFFRIKSRLDGWMNNESFFGITRNVIEWDFLGWRNNTEKLFNEFIIQTDRYTNIYSNTYRWLNQTRDWKSFSPSEEEYVGIISDSNRLIHNISLSKRVLLDNIGFGNNNNGEYLSKSSKISFLNKVFIHGVILDEFLINIIEPFIQKLNDINDSLLDILLSSLNLEGGISFIKSFFWKTSLSNESRFLMNEKPIASLVPFEASVDQLFVNSPYNGNIRTDSLTDAPPCIGLRNRNHCSNDSEDLGNLKINTEVPLRYVSDEANTLEFLDHSYLPRFNYGKRLTLSNYENSNSIEEYDGGYSGILNNVSMNPSNDSFPFTQTRSLDIEEDTISSVQFRVSFLLLPEYSQRIRNLTINHILTTFNPTIFNPNEPPILLTQSKKTLDSILNLDESLLLLTPLKSSPYEEIDPSSLRNNIGGHSGETRVNHRISSGDGQPFFKESGLDEVDFYEYSGKFSNPGDNITENKSHQNDSSLRPFKDSEEYEKLYWLRRFSLSGYSTARSFMELTGNQVPKGNQGFTNKSIERKSIHSSYSIDLNELLEKLKIYRIFREDDICNKWSLFKEYTPWFFTLEWWRYFHDLVIETYPEILLKISDQFKYNIPSIINDIDNLVADLSLRLKSRFANSDIGSILSKRDSFLLKEIGNQTKMSYSKWSLSRFVSDYTLSYSTISILLVFMIFQQYLAAASGSNFIHSWKRFEIIRYSIDPLRGSYLKGVMSSPPTNRMQTKDLLIYSLQRFLNYTNNIIFYSFIKNELDFWMVYKGGLDTLRLNKELLTQYLITNKIISQFGSSLKSSSSSLNNRIDYGSFGEQGFNSLRYSIGIFQKDLSKYEIRRSDPAEKWVLFAFQQNILSSTEIRQKSISNIPSRDIPIPLHSGLFPSKGISLVGPIETGRSYVIKNIAADSYLPLVRIPIKRLLYNKAYFKNVRGTFISKQSVRRLNLVFALAKEMSPCIIWIQDIHELNVNRFYHRSEADPRFLLCLILRNIDNGRRNSYTGNNLVIAPTHAPTEVDPALIAPNRSNQLINIRMSNSCQRQKEFPILLRIKGFGMEADFSCSKDPGFETTGYSKRDSVILANEALLISIARGGAIVRNDAIRLALHRQNSIVTYTDNDIEFSPKYEMLFYKIGKAIIRNSSIDTSAIDASCISNNTLKKRFYYLSNWYLEPSITESTIKEFTILPHVLGLLAGLAARDSWFILEGKEESFIPLDKVAENDLNLACGTLEGLSREFSWLEIRENRPVKSTSSLSQIEPRYYSNTLQKGLFSRISKSISKGINEYKNIHSVGTESISRDISRNTAWSPKVWRLSSIRSGIYESIRIPSEFNHLYNLTLFYQNQEQLPQRDFESNKIKYGQNESHKRKEYLFSYKRDLGKMRQRQIRKLENQLDNILLREQFSELGISDSSNQYETRYDPSNQPILFLGGRFIWDPSGLSHPNNNILSPRRDSSAKEETVRRLYVTYGIRREREKHFSNEKIRNFFLRRGYDRKSMTQLSTNCWKKLPLAEEQHFESIKETQFMKIYLQYPQIFIPVHLYQNIMIENLQERFNRFKLLAYRERWMNSNSLSLNDSTIYNTLFESYQYLFNFFISNRTLLNRITRKLLDNESMLPDDFEDILHDLI